MRIFRTLTIILFVLSVPVALVTTNIRFMANEPRVYRYAIDEFNAPATTGIDRDELIRAGGEIRAYFNNDADTLAIEVTEDGRETSLFNARETLHMKDVKNRFFWVSRANEFSLLYVLTFIVAMVLWSREVSQRTLAVLVASGCVLCLALLGGVGAVGLAGFSSAWEDFHRLMFSNDFWLLNPATDHLIQIFPPDFWERIVFLVGLMIVAEAAFLILAAGLYLGASRHREEAQLEPEYA
ncbi:MAG TPA: TIGR01906 family membrane protein [Dehalococcoidia bacterium]|nr:TIGR01906 family membrane protein [Dehalococcoidia bacterium]